MSKARKNVIAGNWKMNNDRKQTKELIEQIKPLTANASCEVVVCVPFTNLETAVQAIENSNIKVGAQNVHFKESGAYTGEISANMLTELGVEYVIIGHSERRQYFAETDETVNLRVKAALNAGLTVILCVGEMLPDRENGITNELVALQTKIALKDITEQQMEKVVIAYEPVWAIGTGKTATSEQANEVCAVIRGVISDLFNNETANAATIQYGGSMNAQNAEELLAKPDVDGGLIGGASLKSKDFAEIIKFA